MDKKKEFGIGYQVGKAYFRLLINGLFYRRFYALGTENIPEEGTPVLVAMNHQNALNDALGVFFAKNDRKFHFIGRADAFKIHPLLTRFLDYAGVLPAFRLDYEGEDSLENNRATFEKAEACLLDGHTVLIFPEAGHQDKHILGTFSYGYTRLAFQAAEKSEFRQEILILPAANHYSAYTGLRNRMLVRFGTPISLQPYYELYKEKPRTAQREVNKLVREQIDSMMLNVRELENYADIDFLRNSTFGARFARSLGLRPSRLPEKLQADQELVARLEGKDLSAVHTYRKALEEARLADRQMANKPSWWWTIVNVLLLIELLPLGILSLLWPGLICWYLPKYFSDRMGDKMVQSSFQVAVNSLILFPLFFLVTLLVTGILAGFKWGLLHALLIGPLCLFAWYYCKLARETWQDIRFLCRKRDQLAGLRKEAFSSVENVLEK